MKKYKTIIIKNRLLCINEDIKFINETIDDRGNIFYIMNTKYDDLGNVMIDCFDILDIFLKEGYFYKNILVFPMVNYQNVAFKDNTGYIIWLSKVNKDNYFNKDPIREDHIWKDVEWGKRSKNYHDKGKDPGNVWIPTQDDGKGNITNHITLSIDDIISRLINMSDCDENYKILDGKFNSFEEIKCLENRESSYYDYKKDYSIFFKTSECMEDLQNNSIKQAITSPPYWDLKDYFKEGQIGKEPYKTYLDRMYKVFYQTYNKLSDDGSLWININTRKKQGKISLNPRDIITLCKKIGFYYKGIIIWHKSSGIPVGDSNLVDRYEFVFIFSKSKCLKLKTSRMEEFNDYKNSTIGGKSFWNINRKAGSVGKDYKHPAIFPTELARRMILSDSDEQQLLLDPFLGSGTSLIASLENNRYFVGYEFNEEFKDLIEYRLTKEDINNRELVKYVLEN